MGGIMKKIEYYDCFFFDFFGTVMFRDCSPENIKQIWSKHIVKKLSLEITPIELFNIRLACEQLLSSKNSNGEFKYFEMIDEICNRLSNYYDVMINTRIFYDACLSTEIQIEKTHQFVNSKVVEQIRKIKKNKKKVYIVSDFYLDANIIRLFLEDKGILDLFDDVFVSCDFGENKATLGLYRCVKDKINVHDSSRILMTGDNFKSDCINAKLSGLNTKHIRSGNHYDKSIRIDTEFCKLEKENNSLYSDYAFFFYLFNKRLYNSVLNDGIKKLYFLSREGEFLKKLFDDYCNSLHEIFGLPIVETGYLYVSRQSTYAPSLCEALECETFDKLFDEYPNMSVNSFCNNIGVLETDILELSKQLNMNFDCEIADFKNSNEFYTLINNQMFINLYHKTVVDRKKCFTNYIRSNGICENDTIAIVDVGWKGSIQDNIYKACKNLKIYGYYCGLKNNAQVNDDNKKFGLMFAQTPYKSRDYDIWSFDGNFMERLLTASHASTKRYEFAGEKCLPLFGDFDSEKQNYELIKPIQDAIRNKQKSIISIAAKSPSFDNDIYCYAKNKHMNIFKNVNKSHMRLQAMLLRGQMENFGYQKTAGNQMKSSMSTGKIVKRLKENIKLLKNDLLVAHVLFMKGIYGLSAYFYRRAITKVERNQNEK